LSFCHTNTRFLLRQSISKEVVLSCFTFSNCFYNKRLHQPLLTHTIMHVCSITIRHKEIMMDIVNLLMSWSIVVKRCETPIWNLSNTGQYVSSIHGSSREWAIENVHIFSNWQITGCRVVYGLQAPMYENGVIWWVSVHGPVCLRGWWDRSKDFGKSVAFAINRADDEYEAIRARHVFDCGFSLTRK